ncbi:MAG TPA: hypothetical protein VLC98_11590 [Phnomibacter sp.]|nr:hypothetical protein [Phnomibacter sp.]
MRVVIFLMLMVSSLSSLGQSNKITLPTIIPPSPEVAKLSKVGDAKVGLYNGAATADIPLCDLKAGPVSINVALNYNSNGIKVDEIPGRAGLGWNLVAGGLVSRIVHGAPDGEFAHTNPPSNLYAKDQAMFDYLNLMTNPAGGYDTEWDEYSYSFNGFSGKFFLDANGKGHCIPHTNMKVEVTGYNTASKYVTITAPDGTIYEFGLTSKEKTHTIDIGAGATGKLYKVAAYETAWFLEKITTLEGFVVDFTYQSMHTRAETGRYETFIKPLVGYSACTSGDCQFTESSGINSIEYDTQLLLGISSNSASVSFTYENRPDLSGDKRLVGITSMNYGVTVKKIALEYQTPSTNNSTLNKRFFLTKIRNIEPDSNPEVSLAHEFNYNDIGGMPDRLTYAQDWFGYYNGVNNSYLAPYIASIASTVVNGSMGGNREPGSLAHMVKGSLMSIKYPTGGIEFFEYEPHTIHQVTGTPTHSSASVGGSGLGTLSPWMHTTNFTTNLAQEVTIYLSSHKHPAFETSNEGDKIYELRLKKHTTGEVVFYRRYYYYTSESFQLYLDASTQYDLEMTIWGEVNAGTASLNYNYQTDYSYINRVVGGIRVSSIGRFDPIANKIETKYYKYARYPELNKSSGVGQLFPTMYAQYETGVYCSGGPGPVEVNISTPSQYDMAVVNSVPGDFEDNTITVTPNYKEDTENEPGIIYFGSTKVCQNYMVSSNSLNPYYTYAGSNVGYSAVIESDDPGFINGFTQHEFYVSQPGIAIPNIIMGNTPLGTPVYLDTDLNGSELVTTSFKRSSNGSFIPIKKVINDYRISDSAYYSRPSLIVRKRYDYFPVTTPISSEQFTGFDMVQYVYSSKWIQQVKTTTYEYDENGANPLMNVIERSFTNPIHLQPLQESSIQSNGVTKTTVFKYPHDLATTSPENVYQKMVNKHLIQPVIETRQYNGSATSGSLLQTVRTEYKDWFGDQQVFKPEWVATKFKSSSNWDYRLRYSSYDRKGNIRQMEKFDDKAEVVMWGYDSQLSIAQVSNAEVGQVAYTSFEDTEKGSWNYTGYPHYVQDAPMGKMAYDLNSTDISGVVSNSGEYLVSYWKYGSNSVTVNGTSPIATNTPLATGWIYCQHKLTLAPGASIVVSGSATIDELRLQPNLSNMITRNYMPGIGVSGEADNNANFSRYTYDNFTRLSHVKDKQGNILKMYTYNYMDHPINALGNTPYWVPTGLENCQQIAPNNNLNGFMSVQVRDMNTQSASFLGISYNSISSGGACPPLSNCTGEDKRVVRKFVNNILTYVCETGMKNVIASYYSNNIFYCQYYYTWSDGYSSQTYTTAGGVECLPVE